MAWIVARAGKDLGVTRQQLILALCDCAELSLSIFEQRYSDDKRPRQAIDAARAWARGEATNEEMRNAAAAADAASATASAAYAAAYDDAYDDAAAASAAASKSTLQKCADIFRRHFPVLQFAHTSPDGAGLDPD